MVVAILQSAFIAQFASALPLHDLVDSLPGWDQPLFSKTYSGYISAGHEDGYVMHEHYLFFESEGDPKSDPLIMWTNGGPGASSLLGSFSELGPYYLADASLQTAAYKATGIPTLFENPYRWTKLGSLLIRNLPPPIGFSYCDPIGPAGDGHSCGSWNDTKTAKHSFEFMSNWLKAFPEYSKHDLYLTGESYAGLYVPMLAREMLRAGPTSPTANLKGFAVGDGCLGGSGQDGGCTPENGPYFLIEFLHGHGQFSDKTYKKIKTVCSHDELVHGVQNMQCKTALDQMDAEKGFIFDYNVYDECYDFALSQINTWNQKRKFWGPSLARRPGFAPAVKGEDFHMDGTPCGGTAVLPKWVNTAAVKRALHVAENAVFFTADNGNGFTYNLTEPSLVPWYKNVVLNSSLRILIYNGDADPGLNSFYAQNWTSHVGVQAIEDWRPWTRDGKLRMGGYVTRYEGNFDFLTIRGAGHMVPEYKPEAAFVMMKSFLSGSEYPRYKPKAVRSEVII